MNNVIDSIPKQHRATFVQILEERDRTLLERLRTQAKPTLDQRDSVVEIFGTAFMTNLGEDDSPTDRGVQIDDALGAFLKLWPGESLEEA